MFRRTIILLCFSLSTNGYAGLYNLTIHSRANCVNNESISWDARKYHTLKTVSRHMLLDGKFQVHIVDTGTESTWRSAAIHWGEGAKYDALFKWQVAGEHYILKEKTREMKSLGETFSISCNVYDGWWGSEDLEKQQSGEPN